MEAEWWIYRGTGAPLEPAERDRRWPAPPRWRAFDGGPDEPAPPDNDPDLERRLGAVVSGRVAEQEADLVNAALYLRRPLLVTGPPGSGRSTLAYRIARELRLGRVLRWPITSQVNLRSGLYDYGPGGGEAGERIQLGPLGTALLPYRRPRVLLIDELDQCDLDLPHELAEIFDQGEYEVRELVRVRARHPQVVVHTADPGRTATIRSGRVRCHEFPMVVLTGTDERELPSALRRQVLHLPLAAPDETRLTELVTAHFPDGVDGIREVIRAYLDQRERVDGLVPDQLLDAMYLRAAGAFASADLDGWDRLVKSIWRPIAPAGP
jgi:MoxR-like ATPase